MSWQQTPLFHRAPPTRVAVIGSRDYPALHAVHDYIRSLPPGTQLVSGGAARGVDQAAEEAAATYGYNITVVAAEWQRYGRKKAGPIRNRYIVDMVDHVAAFWDGRSPGTRDVIVYATKRQKSLEVFYGV